MTSITPMTNTDKFMHVMAGRGQARLANTFVNAMTPEVSVKKKVAKIKKAKLGSGKRFKTLTNKLKNKKGVYDAKGLAAYIGRKKLGNTKFNKLAVKGRIKAVLKKKRG